MADHACIGDYNSQPQFKCPNSESPTTYISMCIQLMYELVTRYQQFEVWVTVR